jgi:hypothetical protein
VPAGRITGTVIDQRTGAPVPGVTVQVGNVVVTSDATGNYERVHLWPGRYTVALMLDAEQGIPAQEPLIIRVPENTSVTQHLFFASESPAATATIAAAVAAPSPTPTAEAPRAEPVLLPRTLPETAAASAPHRSRALMVVGVLVLGAGLVLLLGGRRRP